MIIRNKSNIHHFILLIFFNALSLTSTIFLKTVKAETHSKVTDLSNHPAYSNYKLDNTEDVVNIGIQPLYLSTGLIVEAIKHDKILRESLSELGVAFGTQHEFEKQSEFLQILSNDISTGLQNALLLVQEKRYAEELEALKSRTEGNYCWRVVKKSLIVCCFCRKRR